MAALSIVVRPKQGHQPHQAVVILPLETGPELGWTGACAGSVARETIEAFCDADTQRMRSVLAPGLRAFITNRDGGVEEADAEEYLGPRGGHEPPERATQAHDYPDGHAEAGYGPGHGRGQRRPRGQET